MIGGLFSSTLLTLFVIPAVYSLFDSLKKRFTSGPPEAIDPAEAGADLQVASGPARR